MHGGLLEMEWSVVVWDDGADLVLLLLYDNKSDEMLISQVLQIGQICVGTALICWQVEPPVLRATVTWAFMRGS